MLQLLLKNRLNNTLKKLLLDALILVAPDEYNLKENNFHSPHDEATRNSFD